MSGHTNDRYNTISAALNIIDPQGTLTTGTAAYNSIMDMILSWMDELEPDEVLRKSESARRMFRYKQHAWL